jgi:hypothetical protein
MLAGAAAVTAGTGDTGVHQMQPVRYLASYQWWLAHHYPLA